MSAICTVCRLSGADHWIGQQCPRCEPMLSAMVRSYLTDQGGWRGHIVSGYRTREQQERFWQGHITNAQIQADCITANMIAADTISASDIHGTVSSHLPWRTRFRRWRMERSCRRSTALWGWRR